MATARPIPPASLRIIRFALLLAPLLLGLVVYLQRRQNPHPPAAELDAIRIVVYGFCLFVAAALLVVQRLRARKQPEERGTWSLIGWAIAESAAMFGAVYMLLGGEPWPYAVGLALILGSWGMLPVEADRT